MRTPFAARLYFVIGRCANGSYQVWYTELAPADLAGRRRRMRELVAEAIDTDAAMEVNSFRARSGLAAAKGARRAHDHCTV